MKEQVELRAAMESARAKRATVHTELQILRAEVYPKP
jgi:hypothetical protein